VALIIPKVMKVIDEIFYWNYKNDINGNKAREFHNGLLSVISNNVSLSDNSYAYQNGKSIILCTNRHKNSCCFIKLDIKNFFNSIDIELLIKDIIEVLGIDTVFSEQIKSIVKSCTYKDILPIGFYNLTTAYRSLHEKI